MKRTIRLTVSLLAAAAAALAATAGAFAAPGATAATPLAPAAGSVLTGVSAGPPAPFEAEVGKHPAVYGEFVTWGQSIHFAFNDAAAAHAVLMLHISTSMGFGAKQKITPLGIAAGDGDRYLLFLSGLISHYRDPVYIRLFPEMDNANNAYSAFNMNGSSRGASYSTRAFIAAWRRAAIVLRGGSVASIDARLAALGQPVLHGLGVGATIATPAVSFVWCPMVGGLPDVAGNGPADYYPGAAYVDWVGTDFYSKFPNFTGLDAFYKAFPGKPFAFGEWAIWGGDNPAFVAQLFKWVDGHPRVRMMVYNQGYQTNGPFRLNLDPASTAAIRQALARPRFLASAARSL
jgi:hypothetical protein